MHTRWRMPPDSCGRIAAGELAEPHQVDARASTRIGALRPRASLAPRRPNAMLSLDGEPGKAGVLLEHDADAVRDASADRACPRTSISPAVARCRPAISSSRVDLPQPDGPTTAKNSPCLSSRSTGPTACTIGPPPAGANTLVTPRSATCVAEPAGPRALDFTAVLMSSGRKLRVDDLGEIDVALDGADHLLHLDHALQAVHVELARAPVRDALGAAGDRGCARRCAPPPGRGCSAWR